MNNILPKIRRWNIGFFLLEYVLAFFISVALFACSDDSKEGISLQLSEAKLFFTPTTSSQEVGVTSSES